MILGRRVEASDDELLDPEVRFSDEQSRHHTYVLGLSGTGKSTLLARLALDDIEQGRGVCVIDPHGDLAEDILLRIPASRLSDVIYLDPHDREFPFGLNLFDSPRPELKDTVCSEVVGVFKKLFGTSWGPLLEDLLRNLVLAMLDHQLHDDKSVPPEHRYNATLAHAHRFLLDYRLRDSYYPLITNETVLLFWREMYENLGKYRANWTVTPDQIKYASSTLNKLRRFLVNPLIANIICQERTTVDLRDVMDSGKILVISLSKGLLGEDNSALIGAVLLIKLMVATLSRADMPRPERQGRPFHLIVDEFQSFATDTFATLLSEARKYNLRITIAHQYRSQLDDVSQGAASNAGNIICFRLSPDDSLAMARQFDYSPPPSDARWEPFPLRPHFSDSFGEALEHADEIDDYLASLPEGSLAHPDPYERWLIKRSGAPRAHSDVQQEIANALSGLPNYQCRIRLLKQGKPAEATAATNPLPRVRRGANSAVKKVMDFSRRCHATPRVDVERRLSELRDLLSKEALYEEESSA